MYKPNFNNFVLTRMCVTSHTTIPFCLSSVEDRSTMKSFTAVNMCLYV